MYLPLVPLLSYLNIPFESLAILGVLLGIDYATGIMKSIATKEELTSCRAISGIMAKGSLLLLVLSVALMAKGIGVDYSNYMKLMLSALIIAETYSISGNVYSIITREPIKETDAISTVLRRIRGTIEALLIKSK